MISPAVIDPDPQLVGYARVSTHDQETDMQLQQLRRARVGLIYEEKASSVGTRPQLKRLLRRLQPGQVLVVYKLDRIARSLKDLLSLLERLERQQCGLRSLTEPIDTSSPVGRLTLQMLGAVAEFERMLIRERTIAGQLAAVRRGAVLGRPKRVSDERARLALARWQAGERVRDIAHEYGVSESALRCALHEARFGHRIARRPPRPVLGPLLQSGSSA